MSREAAEPTMALRKLSSDPLRESMAASLSTSLGGGPSPDPSRTPKHREENRGPRDPRLPLPVILGASLLLHVLLFALISSLPEEARGLEPYEELALDLIELPIEPEVVPPEPEPPEPEQSEPEENEPETQAAIAQEPEPEIDRPEPEQSEPEQSEPEQSEPEQSEPEENEPPPASEEPQDAPPVLTAGEEEAAPNAGSVYSGHGGPGGEPGGTGEGTAHREGVEGGVPGGTGPVRPRPSRAEMVAALRAYRSRLVRFLRGRVRYPRAARRAGEQGTVLLSVRLRPDGHILEVRLLNSSGASSLDDAALEGVRRVTQAPPLPEILPQREGSVRVPIIFELEEL